MIMYKIGGSVRCLFPSHSKGNRRNKIFVFPIRSSCDLFNVKYVYDKSVGLMYFINVYRPKPLHQAQTTLLPLLPCYGSRTKTCWHSHISAKRPMSSPPKHVPAHNVWFVYSLMMHVCMHDCRMF